MSIFCIFPGDDNPGKKLHKLKRVRPRDTDCGPSVARGHFNMPSSPSGYKSQQTFCKTTVQLEAAMDSTKNHHPNKNSI